MTRLDARWGHFWAQGKRYRHFWTSFQDGANAAGATISASASIIPGQASAGVSLDGQTTTATTELIVPPISVDARGPLNTRLNARYRHFWGRGQVWRHSWAQWEGAGISGILADGDLVIASLALIGAGEVAADANVEGDLVVAAASMEPGVASIAAGTPAGIVRGMPPAFRHSKSVDAVASGAIITVRLALDPGYADDLGHFESFDEHDLADLAELNFMDAA